MSDTNSVDIFRVNLSKLLERGGVSQTEVSKRSFRYINGGISQKTISNIRRGEHTPGLDKVCAIARSLNIEPWMMIAFDVDSREFKSLRALSMFSELPARDQEEIRRTCEILLRNQGASGADQ